MCELDFLSRNNYLSLRVKKLLDDVVGSRIIVVEFASFQVRQGLRNRRRGNGPTPSLFQCFFNETY